MAAVWWVWRTGLWMATINWPSLCQLQRKLVWIFIYGKMFFVNQNSGCWANAPKSHVVSFRDKLYISLVVLGKVWCRGGWRNTGPQFSGHTTLWVKTVL